MSKTYLDDNDQLIRAMQNDLNRILSEDSVCAGSQSVDAREAMNAVIAESVRTQRLYFVVRSVLMSLIGALIYFLVVLYLGAIDAFQAAFLGVFVFVASLIASRLFDKQIVHASKKIIIFLNKHKRLRTFVLTKL
jgi:hypothetical protein